jgi:LDH2 family malate/lactate/ureidoglycolate dehydrogenase
MSVDPGAPRSSSKLTLADRRIHLPVGEALELAEGILVRAGLPADAGRVVAEHLVDAELCGVESHGVVRVIQYDEQLRNGYLDAKARPTLVRNEIGPPSVDGGGGIGVPAMHLAMDHLCDLARSGGMAVLPVRNVGHTGRLGAFAEAAAMREMLVIITGGSGRRNWRQAAPYGGRKAILPTNPYCMAIPGGARGPVVIDFATSMIAGGWLHSARAAGALVPEGAIIDADGNPSRDPQAYFDGGAILPKGGPMGYGLAVMAEMICDAMLGPAQTECNWLTLAIDTSRYRDRSAFEQAAEDVLSELRACPPAPGFTEVVVPGERERDLRRSNLARGLHLPEKTLEQIRNLAAKWA